MSGVTRQLACSRNVIMISLQSRVDSVVIMVFLVATQSPIN